MNRYLLTDIPSQISTTIRRTTVWEAAATQHHGDQVKQARTQGGGKVGECPPLGPNVEKKKIHGKNT